MNAGNIKYKAYIYSEGRMVTRRAFCSETALMKWAKAWNWRLFEDAVVEVYDKDMNLLQVLGV